MAKVLKKKVGKMKLKKSKKMKKRPEANTNSSGVSVNGPEEGPGEETEEVMAGSEEELNPELSEEEAEHGAGEEEEEEEKEEDERRRNRLVQAIGSMTAGHRSSRLEERSEAALLVSEFGVTAEGEGSKIQLSDLIPTASKKSQQQIQALQKSQKTLETPLSRQETERIHRDVAFQKVSTEVSQWKSVIQQNQRAEQLVFPLNQEPSGPKRIEHVVTNWKAQTPLEQEIFAVLNANKQPIHNPILTPAEEDSIRAMSLEEAKIRRAELQKARALQSYYEAKARRERKIKSKKYHKVHNKAKRKDLVKKFDEMVKTNPEGALEELKKLEMARMQERMSLKHQNSGKWAKSKAIMAKYDEDARKAMQQQLELNKELTQKVATALDNSEDEKEEEEEAEEVLPDFVNDAEKAGDASNPWMRGKLTEEEQEKEEQTKTEEEVIAIDDESEEEEVENEEEKLLREFDKRRKLRREEDVEGVLMNVETTEDAGNQPEKDDKSKMEDVIELEDDSEEDVVAEDELSEFTSIIRGLTQKPETVETVMDNSMPLEEGLTRIRTLQDVENLVDENVNEMDKPSEPEVAEVMEKEDTVPTKKAKKRKRNIELKEVMTKQSKAVVVPLQITREEAGEEGMVEELDQRGLIKEAFAGDDVISDFLKEKRKLEDAGKPKVVDLTLPGWGEWGGLGLKPSKKKRRRFRVKPGPTLIRKDAKLPEVILSERRDKSVTVHQVNSLPFPFENHTQFESTIRCPLGRTWNSEKTVKKVTQPRVVTQLGAIIEPMGKEELKKSQARKVETNAPTKQTNQRKGPERRKRPAQKRKKHKN